jgi:hypothetical protein
MHGMHLVIWQEIPVDFLRMMLVGVDIVYRLIVKSLFPLYISINVQF